MKLDSNIQTNMHGTAFRAVSSNIVDRTDKELLEEIIPSSNNPKTDKTSNISYQTTQKVENSSLVAFKDPTNDKYVVLSLQKDTISTLKSQFGENDFFQRKDGIIRLDNKAEAFVGGWFGDIAYKREFLKADGNNDGLLDESEYKNTKNEFAGHGLVGLGRVDEYIDKSYVKINENDSIIVRYNRQDHNKPKNIDDELNTTIMIDSDFNKNISLRESYNTKESNSVLSMHNLIEQHVNEAIHLGLLEEDLVLKLLQKTTEEQLERLEALKKLSNSNGNLSTLSIDEKELIHTEIEKSKNEDGLIDTDKLEKIIKNNKTSMIYNEVKSSKMLGEFYEDKG